MDAESVTCSNPECGHANSADARHCVVCGLALPVRATPADAAPAQLAHAMAGGKRPGGLTALAIINFVFAGMSCLNMFSLLGFGALMEVIDVPVDKMAAEDRKEFEQAMELIDSPSVMALMVADVALSVVLVCAGIGYLKQKKFMGRTLGNVYGVVGILLAILGAMAMSNLAGMVFTGAMFMLGLVYPALTLFFLNVTFKEDFVN